LVREEDSTVSLDLYFYLEDRVEYVLLELAHNMNPMYLIDERTRRPELEANNIYVTGFVQTGQCCSK